MSGRSILFALLAVFLLSIIGFICFKSGYMPGSSGGGVSPSSAESSRQTENAGASQSPGPAGSENGSEGGPETGGFLSRISAWFSGQDSSQESSSEQNGSPAETSSTASATAEGSAPEGNRAGAGQPASHLPGQNDALTGRASGQASAAENALIKPPAGSEERIRQLLLTLNPFQLERNQLLPAFQSSIQRLGPPPRNGPMPEFLRQSSAYQNRWGKIKQQTQDQFNAITAREEAQSRNIHGEARRLDAVTGSSVLRNIAAQGIQRQRQLRNFASAQLQGIADRQGVLASNAYRSSFHAILAGEIKSKKSVDRPAVLAQTRASVVGIYAPVLPGDDLQVKRAATAYSLRWIDFFSKEPARALASKPDAPLPPARQEKSAEKIPEKAPVKPAYKTNLTQKLKDCRDLPLASLGEYRRYVQSLARSCSGTILPDVVIDDCRQGNPTVDLRSGCQRNIYSFLLFDSNNYVDRLRGWKHFTENCVRHAPAMELARLMLNQSGRIDSFTRQSIEHGLARLDACR